MKKTFLFALMSVFTLLTMAQTEQFSYIVHNKTHLETKQEYSQKALFPINGKEIQDIRLKLHLGCPDGKCSDWDYSINVMLRKVINGETVTFQLGRMITPYSGWYNRGENAKTWDHIWEWNVTEYLPLLKDSVEIVVSYEGYQDGFLATTEFVFNQNQNKVNADKFLGVENVYYGYYPFGRVDSTIDQFIPKREITIPKGTKKVIARMTVSGHGGDRNNAAAEFLSKNYRYYANNKLIADQSVWKDDCGCNPIQPQGGTWIYNRAGWCPGTKVDEHYYDLTPFVENGKLNIEMMFDYYNGQNSGDAGYQIANDIFFIKDKNYQHLDVEDGKFNLERETISLPNEFILVFKTNEDAKDSYKIKENMGGNDRVLYERSQFQPNTIYSQKVSLQRPVAFATHSNEGACCSKTSYSKYILEINDQDCDGMSWWASPSQGDGYVLIYDKDSTTLLEAFDPDFGCELVQPFICVNNEETISHKENKCIFLYDKNTNEANVIFFNKDNKENEMNIIVRDRRTGDTVLEQSFDKKSVFNEKIDCSNLNDGYYMMKITCNGFTEYGMFSKMKKED